MPKSAFFPKTDDVINDFVTSQTEIFFYFSKVLNKVDILAKFHGHIVLTSKDKAKTSFDQYLSVENVTKENSAEGDWEQIFKKVKGQK